MNDFQESVLDILDDIANAIDSDGTIRFKVITLRAKMIEQEQTAADDIHYIESLNAGQS